MASPFYRFFVSTASPFGGRQWEFALGQLAGFRLKTPASAFARKCRREKLAQVEEQQRPHVEPYMIASQVMEENRRAGFKFFDSDTMKCFKTRVLEDVYDGPAGVFFITSDYERHTGTRWYTVRIFTPATGRVASATSCPKFSTPSPAKTAAAKLSRGMAWDARKARR